MEEAKIQGEESEAFEQARRELLNGVFSLLKNLSIHDLVNEAIDRPRENFLAALEKLRAYPAARKGVEIKFQESIVSIVGAKVMSHFSIVEASKMVPESMEMGLIETIVFKPDAQWEQMGEFFKKWALHCSVHQKPKQLPFSVEGVEVTFVDPEKANLRLKSKNLLLSPTYALNHYYILKRETRAFFEGVTKGELLSQRAIRREILELVEIAKVNPYQLIALSLLRADPDNQEDELEGPVTEAIATSLLSLALARELEFSIRDQVNIGMVGIMYNVGLLSKELGSIIRSEKSLSQSEYKKVLDAQASGVFHLIKTQGSSRPALERLLSLFEATQGNFRKSVSLNLDSRLLRLTSQYVALTSTRPYRDAYLPEEAMKLLGSRATSKSEGNLDPVVYYVFVRLMGVQPVGSLVLLSNSEKAVVFRPSGEKVGVPMVKLLVKEADESSIVVDLASDSNLNVVKSLDARREGVFIPAYFFE